MLRLGVRNGVRVLVWVFVCVVVVYYVSLSSTMCRCRLVGACCRLVGVLVV
jgi:hypothetical protein